MKRLAALVCSSTLAAAIMLGGTAMAASKGLIGISMPTKSSARWIADGANLVKSLEQKGYKTDLQYADDDIPNQLAQVENMITKGSKIDRKSTRLNSSH